MTYPHPATQTITFIPQTEGRDADNNTVLTPGDPVSVPGLYSPGGSVELNNDQQRVISTERVIIPNPPAGFEVNATDQVRVGDIADTFEVDGRPRRYAPGLIVALKRVTG